jgi:Flp pilus assembly protein TadG
MRRIKNFGRDESGAVFVLFALALFPLLGLVGAALDYSRTSAAKVRLQAAVDAGVLFAARDSSTLTEAQVQQRIKDAIVANLGGKVDILPSNISVTVNPRNVTVTATTGVETTILKIAGYDSLPIVATTQVKWGTNDIEIALALDNTGSMGQSNKLNELKKALCGDQTCSSANPTSGFIKVMKDAATYDGQIKISLVPFDTGVRMPQSVQDDVNANVASMTTTTFTRTGAGYCGSNPTTARRYSWFRFADRDKDTTATNKNAANVTVGTGCGVGRADPATWQGCVWDRDQTGSNDANDVLASPVSSENINNLHPAVNCRSNNLARILPLTDVRTNAATLVNAMKLMQPSGNTNLTPGIAWGLSTLTPSAPFTEGKAPSDTVKKFLILLTDGENTENRFTKTANSIDARALNACTNVKNQGVTVYAIRVINGDQALLQACATSISNYKEVADASALTPVFEAIAKEIGAVRLTN